MALVLRYFDKNGKVVDRFVGLVHISDTSACSLKETIYSLLSELSLSPSQIRGQGYDGVGSMRGEINCLKTLIMKDNPSHLDIKDFFCHVTNVLNDVGGSFKCRDLFCHLQAEKLDQLLESGEVHTGRGLNQECGLQRPGDTYWGSHFKKLDNFIVIFSSIIRVLGVINKILQKRDQYIVNTIEFLNITKKRLQDMREIGWESLLDVVSSFCDMHNILIPKMDESYFPGKSKRKFSDITSVSLWGCMIPSVSSLLKDKIPSELNDHFDAVSSDLLLGMASLNTANSFTNFDKDEANLVETYSYVYLPVKFTLILPVATATVERAFSSMKHIKNEERNSMGDQYLNDYLVYYIEHDAFTNVSIDAIIDHF
ncbi:uncharacterized protein [Nicotiana tomentosiformis]|uniref:uncharacterized protein n=1 Tax=Nicotiana tomentosiformis TaxID=4098 RepID=UPI00388C8CDF